MFTKLFIQMLEKPFDVLFVILFYLKQVLESLNSQVHDRIQDLGAAMEEQQKALKEKV